MLYCEISDPWWWILANRGKNASVWNTDTGVTIDFFGGGFKLKLFNIEYFFYFIHKNILQRIDLSVRIYQDGGGDNLRLKSTRLNLFLLNLSKFSYQPKFIFQQKIENKVQYK